jgi:CheY-like chemotaxis protein
MINGTKNMKLQTLLPVSSAYWLEFEPVVRKSDVATPSTARNPAWFNIARHCDRGWKLRESWPGDQFEARLWRSVFQHEAPSPGASLPFAARLPRVSDAVQNRILVADDDLLVRGSLAAVLESEGYLVDEASNGIDAVKHAVENLPDLVLLDLNMPRWDGWAAFSQLDRVAPLLPVIIITARPNQYEQAVRLGVDAFMEKPLSIPVLVDAVKRLISEDESRHARRTTNPAFVTQLLGGTDPD